MRIVNIGLLEDFGKTHTDVKDDLSTWYYRTLSAKWRSPLDIKQQYGTADILPGNRVVFNIKGNHYRLIVKINYQSRIVVIRFIGTHAQYDKINAETI